MELASSQAGRKQTEATATELIAHAKTQLASYKAPRDILVVDSIGRAPNGKADYAGIKKRVEESLAAQRS